MFLHYVELGIRSLRRSIGLTILMIISIAFGVSASMTSYSVFRAVSGDPIPTKSSRLFVPQVDMWGPNRWYGVDKEPPLNFDYVDAMALINAHRATRQSALYPINPSINPGQAGGHLFLSNGYAVFSGFFSMADVPFRFGSAWSAEDDDRRANVIVISEALNEKLFGGRDSVGKTVILNRRDYRVAGVMREWNPQPRYFDVPNTGGFSKDPIDLLIPFHTAIASETPTSGNKTCNGVAPSGSGMEGLKQSTCNWISYIAELDGAEAVSGYRQYLESYAGDQQRAGRFTWSPNVRLWSVPEWLTYQAVVPSDTMVSLLVAAGLLVVCLVNTASMLFTKFLGRSPELAVRRALGASKSAIYAQCIVEAGIIGVAGGLLGLALTAVGVGSVSWVLPDDIASLAHVDISLLILTLIVAIVAAVLAGLYPTFRASKVAPALQLKTR